MTSLLDKAQMAPPIEVFALTEACAEDIDPHKLNLGVGAYRTNDGLPWVLPVVRSVEMLLASDEKLDKEYLPICGIVDMCCAATKLVLGNDSLLIASKKADSCQALGGTGAVYLALQFLHRVVKCSNVLISRPTWPNHRNISQLIGFEVKEYQYWDPVAKNVNFTGMLSDLDAAPELSVVILHACAHNPTGMDLTQEQWIQVAEKVKTKKLFPLFDIAYQGFATGNLDNDAWAIRYFANLGLEMFVAQSFSKNFGLYTRLSMQMNPIMYNALRGLAWCDKISGSKAF